MAVATLTGLKAELVLLQAGLDHACEHARDLDDQECLRLLEHARDLTLQAWTRLGEPAAGDAYYLPDRVAQP